MNLGSLLDIPTLIAPDAPVLISESGQTLTYQEVRLRVAQVSRRLADHGIAAGSMVGILATNCVDAVALLLAASARGAVAVPMNYRASRAELSHLIADSGISYLATMERYIDDVRAVCPNDVAIDVLDSSDPFGDAEPDWDIADVEHDQLAVLLYTSGTTSLPKGVRLSHGALTTYVMTTHDAADGTDRGRSLLAAPLYHIAGLTALLHAVYSGRVTVLLRQFEANAWLDAVERYRVTHAFLVPTMLARILGSDRLDAVDLSSLESITYGAAPMPSAVIERAIAKFPARVEFSGAYGQTETTSTVAVLGPEDHRLDGPDAEVKRDRLRSVGRVVDDVELRIVRPDGSEAETGEAGEVWLRTYRATSGYWARGEGAAAVNVQDAELGNVSRGAVDDQGWIRTGDLGWVDAEGYLFLDGRSGDMIIRGGENVSPEEVEHALYEHDSVADAAVIGVADEEWGERLVAFVVLHEGYDSESAAEDLTAHARAHLAPFKRPSEYVLVPELPRTSTGKLLRRQLRRSD